MKHFNDNLLCSLDIETTGLVYNYHEIVEIAVVPLGSDFKWNKHMMFFDQILRPEYPERLDKEAIGTLKRYDTSLDYDEVCTKTKDMVRFCSEGLEQSKVADMLLDWFERLRLKPKRRIIPLGHNLQFDMAFIKEWLGQESFDLIFDPRWRDTMGVSLFWNDVDGFKNDRCTFKDAKLGSLCTSLKVENKGPHRALDDAMATAECYGRMVKQFHIGSYIPRYDELPTQNKVRPVKGDSIIKNDNVVKEVK